jgi:hypothetical protein
VTNLPCAAAPLPEAVLDMAEPDPEAPEPEDVVPAEPEAAGDPEPDSVPEPADPDVEPALDEPVAGIDPAPEEPDMVLEPPGTMAGEPESVDPEPVAVGRSDEGAVVDCAKAGAASAVAKRQATICFFSMSHSPGVRGSYAVGA